MSVGYRYTGWELNLDCTTYGDIINSCEIHIDFHLSSSSHEFVSTALYIYSSSIHRKRSPDFTPSIPTEGRDYPADKAITSPNEIVVGGGCLADTWWKHNIGLDIALVGIRLDYYVVYFWECHALVVPVPITTGEDSRSFMVQDGKVRGKLHHIEIAGTSVNRCTLRVDVQITGIGYIQPVLEVILTVGDIFVDVGSRRVGLGVHENCKSVVVELINVVVYGADLVDRD